MTVDIEKRKAIIAEVGRLTADLPEMLERAHALGVGAALVRQRAGRSKSKAMSRHADLLEGMFRAATDEHTARVMECGRIMKGASA